MPGEGHTDFHCTPQHQDKDGTRHSRSNNNNNKNKNKGQSYRRQSKDVQHNGGLRRNDGSARAKKSLAVSQPGFRMTAAAMTMPARKSFVTLRNKDNNEHQTSTDSDTRTSKLRFNSTQPTVSLVSRDPASRDFLTTFRTKESTYSTMRHTIVTALSRRGLPGIFDLLWLPSSSNPSGHPRPTLGGRLHTSP